MSRVKLHHLHVIQTRAKPFACSELPDLYLTLLGPLKVRFGMKNCHGAHIACALCVHELM